MYTDCIGGSVKHRVHAANSPSGLLASNPSEPFAINRRKCMVAITPELAGEDGRIDVE